ncbi:MAG TPA: tetratricopeptide repeat protein, partial [Stellaceae bacterium]|nr:tetratricopeptide repeat protein [Stellaceae bacterium]
MSTIDALLDLARAHARQERLAEAEQCFREAVRLAPERDDALAALGLHLQRQSRHAEALPCFTRALAQAPGRADLHNNLGTLLAGLGREAEAEACFLRALRLRPDYAHALTNLGFLKQGRDEEAKSYFYRALASMPALAQARFNLSLSVLAEGDLAAGLFLYEYRPVLEELRRRQPSARPVWDGTAMPGKTLLLLQEQGYGDLIQTIRFAREIRPKVGRLVLKCDAAIAPLMRSAPDLDAVVSDDSALPPVDAYVSTMSLMHRLRITLATLPGGIPYLAAAPDRVARLAPHFAGEGFKVGIVWAGNPAHRSDHRRTLALSALAPLLTLEGVRFFSLQFGPPAEALRQSGLAITDLTPALHDFADTAAALRHLDLVIAVDTALIHLAGALGVPAFLLCPRPADWRWLRERDDSPWYPSLTLFRQERVGDWAPVIERVAKALQARAHSHLGHLAANQNRPHEAAVHFARALLTRPTDATLHHALGLAMNTMSRLPEAELCFRRSLARRPDYREALTHLGHVLGRQNRFAEAEAWHRRALALEPGSADALTQLGITFHVQDRLAEAKELYRRALSLAPDQFIARL